MTKYFIHKDAIVIKPNRQRRTHDPLKHQELIASIRDSASGLQNAIVLRREGEQLVLVSGERRLLAMKEIYELGGAFNYAGEQVIADMIPYTPVGELSELEAEEAELDENIKRHDISWQDRALAVARLSELRTKQAAAANLPPPTVADIALEVRGSADGSNHQATREEIILAKYMKDPDVAAATTPKEAFKILKRKEEKQRNEARAAEVGRTFTSSVHTVLNVDCLAWMKEAPPATFDVILSDPIYGIGADTFGDSGKGGAGFGEHFYDDSFEYWQEFMPAAIEGFTRLAKPEAHVYLFCDFDRFHMIKAWMEKAGWKVFRTPLIWEKPSGYRSPWPEHGPQRKHEYILYAIRGDRKVTKIAGDVLTYGSDENLGHQAQKPVDLFRDLLSRSVNPGDRVLDFSCGSGPIFPAAHSLKCAATGLEIDPMAYGISVKRVEAL